MGRHARVRERGMENAWRPPPAGSMGRDLKDAGVGDARRAAPGRRVQAGEREEAGREERYARGAVRRAQ